MAGNIILVGMPACGKTTIGARLAEVLDNYIHIDVDSLIERTEGMAISKIFEKFSEDYFRKLEYDTIKMICTGENKIISTGGGAFQNPDNRAVLLNFGKVFYLKTNVDTLYDRIAEDMTRPLLAKENPRQILEEMLKKREDNYKKAHYTIDTDELKEDEIVRFILDETGSKS